MEHKPSSQPMTLPTLVFGVVEVRRLLRELDALEEYLRQAGLRGGQQAKDLPRVSRLLDSISTENNINLLKEDDRQSLKDFLANLEKTAPQLHFSFASDPSSAFLAKLVQWLRSNIHEHALLSLGLQPSIAAGCIVRTPNKMFDFSLRQRLGKSGALLHEVIAGKAAGKGVQ